ncbi:MAG: hormogonium polysaccharide biosynthesis protein HpsA [Cyanobacteria bacterium P01_H01_bin.21]
MSTQKRSRVSNRRRGSLSQLRQLPKRFMAWLLRLVFISGRFSRTSQAGFVLPTTVLLILVLSLTVGGLSFRSFSRVGQTIAYREQQQIDNFAVPAVDRAKSKIEYLFTRDRDIVDKRPPSSADLITALLAESASWGDADHADQDPYTLPDETQLDITGDDQPDPAWSFQAPDGTRVVYSLLTSHEARDPATGAVLTDADGQDLNLSSNQTREKANNLVTRNGPINTRGAAAGCPVTALAGDGWQDAGSNLQKNFQINILSISNPDSPSRTVSSAEYQQVRSAPKGNKYGAWFRYDLEVFPGAAFRWNGAMHSESNFIASDNLRAYLVSSPDSCVFSAPDSEITITESADGDGDNIPDGFKGHLIAGASGDDTFRANGVNFHRFDGTNAQQGVNFKPNDDSVNEGGASLTDVAVDPVAIFTEDRSVNLRAPGGGSWTPVNGASGTDYLGRVSNVSDSARPFLDDGYRADNRYGPKPVYDALNSLSRANSETDNVGPNLIGDVIDDNPILADDDPAAQEYGLDGYWERRSTAQGLRVVVGQRLELGNQFGWQADDPLYPPTEVKNFGGSRGIEKGPAEAKQQRSLRDNLSAVQGMVVYHYTHETGQSPYICMASTVHPGTDHSLINSRTFANYPSGARKRIDFFTGQGTNGWEFDFASLDSDGDGTIADEFDSGAPMGQALRNLAYFAGDPAGGAPSFPPVQGQSGQADEFVHPYPYLSMWGDFSILRRIFAEYLDGGLNVPYTSLSIADKSTLQSAACTVGMLARNIEDLRAEFEAIVDARGADIVAAVTADANTGRTFDDWLGLFATLTADEREIVELYRQVQRDRIFGFIPTDAVSLVDQNHSLPVAVGAAAAGTNLTLTCDPAIEFPATYTVGGAAITDEQRQALAFGLCALSGADSTQPAFPALHYVLPSYTHSHLGATVGVDTTAVNLGTLEVEFINEQPDTEEYISEKTDPASVEPVYIADGAAQINDAVVYEAIDTTQIALAPRTIANFRQPYTAAATGLAVGDRNALQRNTIVDGATAYDLAFLDKAMMDGRELLSVRVLDLDINKLTLIDAADARTFFTVGANRIAWIPEADGLFYAAREDAVREDNIVRPRQATWATCQNFTNLVDNAQNCPMAVAFDAATPGTSNQVGTFDPPLADNQISPKPVDMYADPDRRPYGFRLINGATLNRSADDRASGLTFVSDNPAYIYGNFNLHQDAAGAILEEFQAPDLLGIDFATEPNEGNAFNQFYGRQRANLDTRFSRGGQDLWRPSEIFADAVTILSDSFRDGWVEDAYLFENDGDKDVAVIPSSYLNANRPSINTRKQEDDWQREDLQLTSDTTNTDLPIRFDRNGLLAKARTEANANSDFGVFPDDFQGRHISFDDNSLFDRRQENQIPATDTTRVNALLIAGIVPLRSGQNYGGLHNFPRLLEYWDDKSLIISGGFFQLNFSTHATAPFDQDAWEPGAVPISAGTNNVKNAFYGAARRIWGYDVGFQYTSVAPIARRFVSFGRPRSEFYRELPLDDPYVDNLCKAEDAGDNPVVANAAGNSVCQ